MPAKEKSAQNKPKKDKSAKKKAKLIATQSFDLQAANSSLQSAYFDQREVILQWLEHEVPQSRIQHILGVEFTAIALAKHHNLDPTKAAQAGLMHDLAKYFKPKRLLEIATSEGIPLDPVDEANPHLLHADVSAIVARDEFAVQDAEILEAIANHTLGSPGMGRLSCVIFVADCIEPGRSDSPELAQLREVSYQNLDQAVWLACDYCMGHVLSRHKLLHPRAVNTRNWFLQTYRKS